MGEKFLLTFIADLNTFTHSPMINRKSISILNKKFKREREEKVKKETPKLGKHHFDYKNALNKDINITVSPKKKNEI